VWIAVVTLTVMFVFAWQPIHESVPAVHAVREAILPLIDKTHFGLLRFAHFLALAYLAYAASGPLGINLRGRFFDLMRRVGRQTLAVFLVGLVAAQIVGMLLDTFGRDAASIVAFNLLGFAALATAAELAAFFRSPPWRAGGAFAARSSVVASAPPGRTLSMPRR
jgi:hypothetical protein